ncbi:MAG: TIM barrel protein [Steroidobacteraceae bacterium]
MTSHAKPGLKLGTTLFSFTGEYHSREYTFEQLIAEVARRNLGPGLEIIGFQSIRGFPAMSDAFAERFRELMAQHGLQPSCFDANSDVMLRRGQMLSIEEQVAYHEPQIRAAAKLGFPTVRCQFTAPPEVLRRLVPLAEKLNVKMGPEIHAPLGLNSPPVVAYREMYAKVNSPCLGFVPDFGSTARSIPEPYLDTLRERGIPERLIQMALEIWKLPLDAVAKRAELGQRLGGETIDPTYQSALGIMYNIMSPNDVRSWLEIMPQIIHVHGKFYGFDAAGNEASIDYPALIRVLVEGGYQGYMSSEYEGHMYSDASAFEALAKHHALCRRVLAAL